LLKFSKPYKFNYLVFLNKIFSNLFLLIVSYKVVEMNFNSFEYNLSSQTLNSTKPVHSLVLHHIPVGGKHCIYIFVMQLIGEYIRFFTNFIFFKITILNITCITLFNIFFYYCNSCKDIKMFFYNFFFFSLYNKVKEFLIIDTYTQFNWYFKIYLIFNFYSLFSLLPKINSVIAILAIPTYCSL